MTLRKVALLLMAALALLAAAALWLLPGLRPDTASLLRPKDARLTAQGAEIYLANCASCHGVDLEGQPEWKSPGDDGLMPAPPHNETGHTWHHPDRILFDITKLGVAQAAGLQNYKSAMPAYESELSDAEIVAVLSWIKAQWPDGIQKRHDAMNERYALEPKL